MSETANVTEAPKNDKVAPVSDDEVKKQTDCYFYLHQTCNKGDRCEFRHSEAARGTQTVCREWVLASCPRGAACPSRHPSKQTAKPFSYTKPFVAAHHSAPFVDRSQTPCYYYLMGTCAKGAACPFSHSFKPVEAAASKASEDEEKPLRFTVKNDAQNGHAHERQPRDKIERDESSRHSNDSARNRPQRQREPNVVFELPGGRKGEQRARSNSDAKAPRERLTQQSEPRRPARQEREAVASASIPASKEERQRLRDQERAQSETAHKASFGVKPLNALVPAKEDAVGTKRARDSAEESPNKRRKVEGASSAQDELDRELDALDLPVTGAASTDVNDDELLDI